MERKSLVMKQIKRGYTPEDEKDFGKEALVTLSRAGSDICYLLNQGYRIGGAATFVCDHYRLSKRQRIALIRWAASDEAIRNRKARELADGCEGRTLHVDGFNTIITLEVALSGSPVILCKDGCLRDLAGLRGTYHPIDKTIEAVNKIGSFLEKEKAGKVIFYLDAPVSNSGRLKVLIQEELAKYSFLTEAYCINGVDGILKNQECVVTADSAVLDRANSYFNLNLYLISDGVPGLWLVDFLDGNPGKVQQEGGTV